jgi:hypothetical protein
VSRAVPSIHLDLHIADDETHRDGVKPVLQSMDRQGVERAMIPVDVDRPEALRALKDHPDRFFGCYRLDPNRGMDELCTVVALCENLDIRALSVSPALLVPQVPIDGKRLYPFYAKAVELGLPVCCSAGVPTEAVPMGCQHPRRIDEVCAFFPELRLVLRDDGAEPWARLIVTLLRRRENLHYASNAAAAELPEAIVDHANSGGAGRVLFAGGGRGAALHTDVRAHFLRENARRLFHLS